MATLFQNNFEGGTNASSITSGNSGGTSGDAFPSLTVPANSAITFATAGAAHGSLGMAVTTTAASVAVLATASGLDASARYVMRFYLQFPVLPTAPGNIIAQFRIASGASGGVGFNSTGRLAIYNASGSSVATAVSASPLVINTLYRVELAIDGPAGSGDMSYFLGDSTTAVETFSVTAQSFGGANIVAALFGRPSPTAFIGTFYFDDIKVQAKPTGMLGPVSNATSPVRTNAVLSNAGVFTNVGGAASLQAALADESDTTYIQSPTNPAGASINLGFAELSDGLVTVSVRHSQDVSSPNISRLYELMQGATVISSRTVTPLPTTITAYSWTTSTGEAAAITDRTALSLRVTDS